jgi:hypothetical protein
MPLSEQILAWAIGHGNTLLFGLAWFIITAVAAICVVPSLRPATILMSKRAIRRPIDIASTRRQIGTPSDVVMLTLLASSSRSI